MRIPRLPIGQKNVIFKTLPARKAKNSEIKKGWDGLKTAQTETAFNTPTLCIVLRKAA